MLAGAMNGCRVTSETEENGCWLYEVELELEDGPLRVRARLAWEDYDLWVRDGSVEPARVAEAMVRWLSAPGRLEALPNRLDSSHPRRIESTADEQIVRLIRETPLG